MLLAEACLKNDINNFIYASSGSVYGIQSASQVTEDLELKPISGYNKTKMIAERVLISYKNLDAKIIDLQQLWSFSRMRLDVAVNLLTFQALEKGEMTVLGGDQVR